MKLTTKIIIGIILSIFVITLLHIIIYSFTDRKYNRMNVSNNYISIPDGNKPCFDVKPYRVIIFSLDRTFDESQYYYMFNNDNCGLFINPAPEKEKENTLVVPETLNNFISTQIKWDTLIVKINFDELRKKYRIQDEEFENNKRTTMRYGIVVSGLNLYLHSSNINIINNLDGLRTKIKNIETDSIKIYSMGHVTIDSCKAILINPVRGKDFTLTNSSAKILNIDFDLIQGGWKEENNKINIKNYTGSRDNHEMNIKQDIGCKDEVINWLPKNKDAKLNIRLNGDTAQLKVSWVNQGRQ